MPLHSISPSIIRHPISQAQRPMPSPEDTLRFVDEWYEGTKEWEASGGASSTEHLLLLLKAALISLDLKHFKKEGYTPLHALADMDKSKKTRCLEEKGVNMLGSVKLLQKCGLDIDTKSGNDTRFPDWTPLHRAAREGHFDLVKGLVGAGANVNEKSGAVATALSFAAGADHSLILRYLLRHGAEVEGSEALHCAACVGSPEGVEALLKAGAKPNERDGDGDTAAQVCCMGGKKKGRLAEALSLLLKGGANAQIKTQYDNETLLHLAAGNGNVQCLPLLLERGLQLDARDGTMNTPLQLACYSGSLACVKELMCRGASVNLANSYGCTPLFDAVRKGHVKIASELIRAGASVKVKSTTAMTPLHLAAALGNMELSYLLVEAEAEIDALTNTGQSPLMACMHPAEQAVSDMLEGYLAEPGSQEAREKVAAFLLKRSAAVDGKVIALAGEKGFGDVLASFFCRGREERDALSDRFDTVAEHFAVTADGDDERADDVVQVRLVNKATGEMGRKTYSLSIPLVEQLMAKVREREDGTKSAGNSSSAAGILPTLLDPAKYGYKSGKKGKGKDKKKEIELEYDGVNFTEEGFEAVVKFVTTGSVEKLLTRRPGSAGNESSSGAEGGSSSSSSGTVRKECAKLFDEIRAKQALQAAEFFCLEGLSREVKALMDEYGFTLQEGKGTGGGGREGAEGEPSRKKARADPDALEPQRG